MFPSIPLPVDRDPCADGVSFPADLSHARRTARAKNVAN
ncbi:hypothetical protein NP493_29g04052 [Ridgeia piscesae]|uniref:Uncharacterized protein n=1 Tax=Ridgeia piscesae TaxID=27915 RepID=A0AAD9UKD7_RIDPI|nr:hypothetical protein NP493_29g04052 [Ridgeia piscesae]